MTLERLHKGPEAPRLAERDFVGGVCASCVSAGRHGPAAETIDKGPLQGSQNRLAGFGVPQLLPEALHESRDAAQLRQLLALRGTWEAISGVERRDTSRAVDPPALSRSRSSAHAGRTTFA